MKYKILEGYLNPFGANAKNIEKMIQEHLDCGWVLYGNLILIEDYKFCQAVILKGKE